MSYNFVCMWTTGMTFSGTWQPNMDVNQILYMQPIDKSLGIGLNVTFLLTLDLITPRQAGF